MLQRAKPRTGLQGKTTANTFTLPHIKHDTPKSTPSELPSGDTQQEIMLIYSSALTCVWDKDPFSSSINLFTKGVRLKFIKQGWRSTRTDLRDLKVNADNTQQISECWQKPKAALLFCKAANNHPSSLPGPKRWGGGAINIAVKPKHVLDILMAVSHCASCTVETKMKKKKSNQEKPK